jgi:hypothetical protein
MNVRMMLSNTVSKRPLLIGLGLLVAALFAQGAKADTIDFSCGSGSCTGTVVANGGNFSTAGIGLASSFESDPFSLVFNTATGVIQLVENGTDAFSGTITGFSSLSGAGFSEVALAANWTTIPTDVGGSTGLTPFSFVISLSSTGQAYSVDIPISTPEPSTLMLLGAGLVGLVLFVKFKGAVPA